MKRNFGVYREDGKTMTAKESGINRPCKTRWFELQKDAELFIASKAFSPVIYLLSTPWDAIECPNPSQRSKPCFSSFRLISNTIRLTTNTN